MLVGNHTFELVNVFSYVFHKRLERVKIELCPFFVVDGLGLFEKLYHLAQITPYIKYL